MARMERMERMVTHGSTPLEPPRTGVEASNETQWLKAHPVAGSWCMARNSDRSSRGETADQAFSAAASCQAHAERAYSLGRPR